MWENYIKVNVSLMKKNLICAYIINHENQFWISCVYGCPELHLRFEVWNELIKFAFSLYDINEWITIEDFNQVLTTKDKLSLKNNPLRRAEQLQECLNICNSVRSHPKASI